MSRGEAKLLAVTITKDNPWSAVYVDLVNTFYGRAHIPVGMVRRGVTPEDSRMIQAGAWLMKKELIDGCAYARRSTAGNCALE